MVMAEINKKWNNLHKIIYFAFHSNHRKLIFFEPVVKSMIELSHTSQVD